MTNKTDDRRLVQMPFPEVSDIDRFVRNSLGTRSVDHVIILRQRDFSVVGRVFLKNGGSVIYQNAPKGFALQGGDVRRDRASGQSGVCCC